MSATRWAVWRLSSGWDRLPGDYVSREKAHQAAQKVPGGGMFLFRPAGDRPTKYAPAELTVHSSTPVERMTGPGLTTVGIGPATPVEFSTRGLPRVSVRT